MQLDKDIFISILLRKHQYTAEILNTEYRFDVF
jgi:hypothetical protein